MTEWKEVNYWTEYDAIHNAKSRKDARRRIAEFLGESKNKSNKKKEGRSKWK